MKKIILAALLSTFVGATACAEMPNMNATDNVYGYHLRDVYKDMEQLKYDDTNVKNEISNLYNKVNNIPTYDDGKLRGDVNDLSNKLDTITTRGDVLANSITNLTNNFADTSNRIDRMENTINNSITNIHNDMGVVKNDVANHQQRINNLESNTNQLNNHVNSLSHDVSSMRNDIQHLKSDTAKGLAQANALSSLKYLGGKGLQLSVGVGGYRGTSAIAYGLFYGVNDELMLYAGGTNNSYNASINLKIGGK